jgi:hypothetical protein
VHNSQVTNSYHRCYQFKLLDKSLHLQEIPQNQPKYCSEPWWNCSTMSDYTSLISEYQPWANECDKLVVETSHGVLRGYSKGKGEPAILCIHGNSFCLSIFEHIIVNTKGHRVVAFDLPGHGASSDAHGK